MIFLGEYKLVSLLRNKYRFTSSLNKEIRSSHQLLIFLSVFIWFPFIFEDVTEPSLTCPSDIVVNATGESATTSTVPFLVSCQDNIDKSIQPICNATENITPFSVGETTVVCSCQDSHENVDGCSFIVTVEGLSFSVQQHIYLVVLFIGT